jgi:hypothetical protein
MAANGVDGVNRKKGDFGMNEWLFVILTIIIAVIALMWGLGRLDFSGINGLGGSSAEGGTIVFSQVENKVSAGTLDAYLEKNAGEKLKGKGGVFYNLGVKYDIDPAFAVGVAQKETSLGKKTCQGISQGCNNFFCIKASGNQADCSGWASYSSPEQGIEAFYSLIKTGYVSNGQDTIAEIGCAPGSGYSSHCYCTGKASPYCTDWVGGSSGVPQLTGNIRDYAA